MASDDLGRHVEVIEPAALRDLLPANDAGLARHALIQLTMIRFGTILIYAGDEHQ